ncbi:MAG: N-acetyl-alpha-D-glucosaminyl L-malate synthase BshA [Cytophagales bacterium]
MKIGIVCYPTYGGSGVVATELGKAMAQLGHQIHFITYDHPSRLDIFNENLFYHEVSAPNYPLFQYLPYETALSSAMVNVVKNEKLDLLHVHYAIPHASAAYMAKQILKSQGLNIPVVTTLHGTDITLVGKDASYEPVVTFSINESDGVTAVSESLKQETLQFFNITKDIQVIPNFIDLNRFKKQNKEHFKKAICPRGEKLIVHTSNFRPVKRVMDVYDVFVGIKEKIPSKLILIGDGPDRGMLEEKCRHSGHCEDVRFIGKLDVIEDVLSVCDLFLLPSEKESFGLSALEAMACEVPVVSSNAGGIPELNVNGYSGYLCEVGDVASMIEKSLHVLSDENLPIFKSNALKRAQEFEEWKIVKQYESFYEEIISKCLSQIES